MPIVRRLSIRCFSSRQQAAVSEISKLAPSSNRPIRKKICLADRKAMLQSFVNKYRATNLGKFPSPTSAQKEIGGSYYLIRKMIQEMEYDFKISSVEKGLVQGNKQQTKSEDTISREIAIESSRSQEMDEHQSSTSSTDTRNSNITKDDTDNIATESHDGGGESHEKLEQKPNDESTSKDNFALKESDSNVEKQHDGISTMRDVPEQQKDDEVREKPSIWGNLKSFANGFFNIWK